MILVHHLFMIKCKPLNLLPPNELKQYCCVPYLQDSSFAVFITLSKFIFIQVPGRSNRKDCDTKYDNECTVANTKTSTEIIVQTIVYLFAFGLVGHLK